MFQKCEFCQNWDFRNVNFSKNEILEMWILWKMRFQKCEFCKNWDFRNVNLVKIWILEMWIFAWTEDFDASRVGLETFGRILCSQSALNRVPVSFDLLLGHSQLWKCFSFGTANVELFVNPGRDPLFIIQKFPWFS